MIQAAKDNVIVTNHVLGILDRMAERGVKRERGLEGKHGIFVDL